MSKISRRTLCQGLGVALLPVAKPFAAAAADTPVLRLKRGVSVHHLLNWPEIRQRGDQIDYVWPPFQEAKHRMSDGEMRRLATLGFDFVRLTVDPSIFVAADASRFEQLMEQSRQIIARFHAANLKVIFDLHPSG